MTGILLAVAIAVAMPMVLAWSFRARPAPWDRLDRCGALIVLLAASGLSLLAVTQVLGSVWYDWNGARLAPIVALRYGYRLYYPATEGPISNHAYGPVMALAYLPTALFRTPTTVILVGSILQIAFVFGPMLLYVVRATGGRGTNRPLAWACGLGACLLLARYRGTSYWITAVNPDGPALGLGILACLALLSEDGAAPSRTRLVASATAAVLACWTKQTAAPLPLALLTAVWLAHGRTVATGYLMALAGIGIAISGVLVAAMGEPMLFNMFVMLGRQAWYRPGLAGVLAEGATLLGSAWEVLAGLGVALLVWRLAGGEVSRVAFRPWMPLLLAAAFLFPTGALGANKLGGEENAFHSMYYLIAALATMLADAGRSMRLARAPGYVFCVVALLAAWNTGRLSVWASRRPLWQNKQQLAYEFALRHPGEVYFPWYPLATLMAEGRLYHFEYGMFDRFLGGFEPTPNHVRAYVPPRMHWIAGHERMWCARYFPEYSRVVTLPDLPGWVVRGPAVP